MTQFLSPSKTWRMQKLRYRLVGSYCSVCGTTFYPSRSFCPNCHRGDKLATKILSPRGKILSWSVIYAPPSGFSSLTPYVIALVKLGDGPTIFTQITDCVEKDLRVGLPVEAVFRKLRSAGSEGIIQYGLKFRPAGW